MQDAGMVEKKSAGSASLWMREAVEAIDKQFGMAMPENILSWWQGSCRQQPLIRRECISGHWWKRWIYGPARCHNAQSEPMSL